MADATAYNRRYCAEMAEEMAQHKGNYVRTVEEQAVMWVQREGAVFCTDPTMKMRLAEYVAPVAALFPDLMERVAGVYPYFQSEQLREDLQENDGIAWKFVSVHSNEVRYVIGISVEALEAGPEYVQFLFLHELAHNMTDKDHSTEYHRLLDSLIKQFNQATGANIVNDYFGHPMRHDSRSYKIPDGIPVQQSRKGAIYRTEEKGRP